MDKNPPSLFLLRGLPGSGKSTLAESLSEGGKYPVFSIDSYFTNPQTGEYIFEFSKNHVAYKTCEELTMRKMKEKAPKVFVDNTFTMEWEMEPYFKMAAENGYRVFVMTVENRHGGTNIHSIPEQQLRKMSEKFKVRLW